MRDLYLVRHGQAQDGESGMDRDFHLTDLGRQQAHALGRQLGGRIERLDAMYVSRLTRARETAEILCQYLRCPVHERRELIEHGSEVFLLDCSRLEAAQLHPDKLEADGTLICHGGKEQDMVFHSVGGESLEMLHNRARAAYEAIVTAHPGPEARCMIVAHGSFLSALVSEALRLPLRAAWSVQMANAAMLHLRLREVPSTGSGQALRSAQEEADQWPFATIVIPGPLEEHITERGADT